MSEYRLVGYIDDLEGDWFGGINLVFELSDNEFYTHVNGKVNSLDFLPVINNSGLVLKDSLYEKRIFLNENSGMIYGFLFNSQIIVGDKICVLKKLRSEFFSDHSNPGLDEFHKLELLKFMGLSRLRRIMEQLIYSRYNISMIDMSNQVNDKYKLNYVFSDVEVLLDCETKVLDLFYTKYNYPYLSNLIALNEDSIKLGDNIFKKDFFISKVLFNDSLIRQMTNNYAIGVTILLLFYCGHWNFNTLNDYLSNTIGWDRINPNLTNFPKELLLRLLHPSWENTYGLKGLSKIVNNTLGSDPVFEYNIERSKMFPFKPADRPEKAKNIVVMGIRNFSLQNNLVQPEYS